MPLEDIRKTREEKLAALRKAGIEPYPAVSKRTHTVGEALGVFEELSAAKTEVALVGRMMLRREHGGSAFFHFEDASGRMQGYAKKNVLGEEHYKRFLDDIDVGDFIEILGTLFATKKGERTVEAQRITVLSKSLLPLPEKWHGLTDVEERFRKRYLDLVMSPGVREKFVMRSKIVSSVRDFFSEAGFLEVETPMLQTLPGGALARPFATRMEALNLDLYLRVAPELYLKRLLVGGFEKVFEIGRCFRNEGMDKEHNPEFTMLEAYAAYRDYEWLMGFTENLFSRLAANVAGGDGVVVFGGKELHFSPPFARVDFAESVGNAAGVDYFAASAEELLAKAKERGIAVEKVPTKAAVADEIFKKAVRPALTQPTFVVNHPLELSPLAKTHRDDPRKTERFQLVAGGMELTNAFSELNDPLEQRRRFEAQEASRKKGDEESHRMDEDFLEALEYGMPPAAGIGIGIDRLARVFADAPTVREVLLFPTMRPHA